ncbi:MAG: CHASE2 domain-containing protein [Cyanobacteria bacterium SID2]|nr:CHASE2 domain-containing protein [Cyanobacteria bacterium SID2]
MERLVVFKLDGTFDRGFQVQLEIWSATTDTDALSGSRELVDRGFLPPNPQLLTCLYEHWNQKYRQIGAPARRKAYYRLKPQEILYDGCLNAQIRDCHRSAQHLEREFEQWLHSESLQDIELRLREEIDPRETVRFLIHTDDPHLPKLPWHLWRFFKRYRQAEVAFCPTECKKLDRAVSDRPHVKILAVLGHRNGIDVESDLQILQALPNAEVTFLVEPNRQDINDRLWLEPWDIIFFAGHSETEGEEGRIYLNPHDSLSISELWFGLRTAVDRGLKLAIFNSCDGLGLTRKLDDLQIPIAIVMRELVPDRVAQAFLKYFLTSFSSGQPFFLAVREARERLQGLENEFPCASWLPLIYQNPIEVPPTWEQLQCPPKRPPRSRSIQTVGLVSFLVTLFVMGARSLGILEPLELLAYDWLMRRRPPESIDSRITVVEVTEKDLRYYGNPLSDEVLARLTAKLTAETPTAIGFNLYLARPQGGGREALMQQLETHPDLA